MSAQSFEPGAEYLVTAPLGELPVHARVVFWRHAYSPYDGIDFYFFATPEAYYEGRPGPDGRPEPAHLFAYEHPVSDRRTPWMRALERIADPRPGPAWLAQWWERAVADAMKPRP